MSCNDYIALCAYIIYIYISIIYKCTNTSDTPCPPPYYVVPGVGCILVVTDQPVNYKEAISICNTRGGKLASPATDEIFFRLAAYLMEQPKTESHFGETDNMPTKNMDVIRQETPLQDVVDDSQGWSNHVICIPIWVVRVRVII